MKLLKQFIAVLVFSLCLSAPSAAEQILIPIYVDASSTLQVSGYNYSPLNIQDFNCETAWTEGVKGTGIGEELYLHITVDCHHGRSDLSRLSEVGGSVLQKCRTELDPYLIRRQRRSADLPDGSQYFLRTER